MPISPATIHDQPASHNASTTQGTSPSPKQSLDSLPQELRDQIYTLTLSTLPTPTIQITATYLPPSLLQINRSIRADVASRYYSTTKFQGYTRLCKQWLRHLTPETRRMIRTLRIFLHDDVHSRRVFRDGRRTLQARVCDEAQVRFRGLLRLGGGGGVEGCDVRVFYHESHVRDI